MKVPYYKGKKRTRRFFRKNSGSFKNHKNVLFLEVFRDYLGNATNDFSHFCSECSPWYYLSACENRLVEKIFVLKIFEVRFLNFLNDPKNFFENFLKKFLNGPIRKVIMSKVKLEDLRSSPSVSHPRLSHFSAEKWIFFFSFFDSEWLNSRKKAIESEI